ncbi:MAG: redoxin domain-containing protein [Planctomycetes bacterium]|nr:redoxin domain-containing protein [Planctomycetota bacterium]
MNRNFLIPIGVFFSIGWLASLSILEREAFAVENLKAGDPLPAFSLPRADKEGEYKSDQLKGRPAAIVFWRPHQSMSLDALRDLKAVAQEISAGKLQVVAVDASNSPAEKVQAALASENLTFPILLDPQRTLYGKVGVIVAPTTLLLDAQGVLKFILASHPIQYRQVIRARLRFLLGEINEQQMSQEIEPTVFKIDQNLAAAWRMFNLGSKLQAEGKPDQAVAIYEKAISQAPSFSEARCALGFLKLAAGDLDAAAQHFRTALANNPTLPLAQLGWSAVLARTGEDRKAEQILLSLIGQQSIASRVRYELGRIYKARGETDKALTFFQDALAAVFPEPVPPAARPAAPAAGREEASKTSSPPAQASRGPSKPTALASEGGKDAGPTAQEKSDLFGIAPVKPRSDARYLGVSGCKKCHFQQWKTWQETKMANAFKMLMPGAGSELKSKRKLDPNKDYSTAAECLGCHTTGFGFPGGYPSPSAGDASAAALAKENAGIGCESCHGPGAGYMPIHKEILDKKRPYKQQELLDAGQFKVDGQVCAACHNDKAPCIEKGYLFDFEKRKAEGTHGHFTLQFQAK